MVMVGSRAGLSRWGWLLACWIGLAGGSGETGPGAGRAPDMAAARRMQRAALLMDRFDFRAGEQALAELIRDYPTWREPRLDRAIAILNRGKTGDQAQALLLVESFLKGEPGSVRAHYLAGLIQLQRGEAEPAAQQLQQAVDGDPQDAYAAYFLAEALSRLGRHDEALVHYQQATGLDPLLRSAYYGVFQSLQHLTPGTDGRVPLERFQRLARNPQARKAEFRYTRMGPKAEVRAPGRAVVREPAPLAGSVFEPERQLGWEGSEEVAWSSRLGTRPPSDITVTDWNGDGIPDLFLADALNDADAPNLLLEGLSNGGFRWLRDHPLAKVPDVNAALWGDLDYDGRVDVYLCRRGPNQLWRQTEPGHWLDDTAASGTSGGDVDTQGGALFDADHDGDLDIWLVNGDAPNELFSNNRNGTFRPLAEERGVAGDGRPSVQALPVDLNADRDLDLILLHRDPPHEVYLNDRLWNYRAGSSFEAFVETPALAAVAVDQDRDGCQEVFTLTPDGRLLVWSAQNGGTWESRELKRFEPTDWGQLAVLDGTGGGVPQILVVTAQGWSLVDAQGRTLAEATGPADRAWRGALPLVLDPARGPGILGLRDDGVFWWAPGVGRYPFLTLALSGSTDYGVPSRSNGSGIGTQVLARAGARWSTAPVARQHSGPGQGFQPLSIGLGGARQADRVSLQWPDGTIQTELDLEAGRIQSIPETRRHASNSPVLFAWNGSQQAFVTDLLAGANQGYAVGPGEYAPVRPWENLPVPEGLVQPRNGRFGFKLTQPISEVAYIDGARLVIWELPPEWRVVLDERLGVLEPKPTGAARFYREELSPVKVWNEREEDVTDVIRDLDGRAAPPGDLDPRFIGRLAGEHILTLEFDQPLDGHAGDPVLVADGWVELPYSQTLFSAWQAGADYWAPTLEAQDKEGNWQLLREQFGYPAGMRRRISVALGQLPAGTQALRIRSNMEIYWDRMSVVFTQPQPEMRRHELFPVAARVGWSGFPNCRRTPDGPPRCDYEQRAPFADVRVPAGLYTAYGDALPLLAETDDALAIIGPGDELELEYAVPQVPAAPGWSRFYVLEVNGWVKDMDLYTKDGETVEPLPDNKLPDAKRDELHRRFNTRYRDGD